MRKDGLGGVSTSGSINPPETTPTTLLHGNPSSSVAVCTLSSADLHAALASSTLLGRIAMLGALETENTGIEALLKTLLQTPSIRWLILCGDQNPRRKQGDALRTLFAEGVGPNGNIGSLPNRRLPTLRPTHVDAAREQVQIVDLIGVRDLAAIGAAVDECAARPVPPLPERRVSLPADEAPAIEVPARPFRVQHLDPAGYFVIAVDRAGSAILVEHRGNNHALHHRLRGPDAESLLMAILEWGLASRSEHLAYLGLELARAETALRLDLPYRQDARTD